MYIVSKHITAQGGVMVDVTHVYILCSTYCAVNKVTFFASSFSAMDFNKMVFGYNHIIFIFYEFAVFTPLLFLFQQDMDVSRSLL